MNKLYVSIRYPFEYCHVCVGAYVCEILFVNSNYLHVTFYSNYLRVTFGKLNCRDVENDHDKSRAEMRRDCKAHNSL
jgi:hypothetical protein